MEVYILSFVTSCLMVFWSEKVTIKRLQVILIILSLLITATIAGLRSTTIGTDVKTYVEPIYVLAKDSMSYTSFLNSGFLKGYVYTNVYSVEVGYTFFIYAITKVFGTLSAVLFFTQLFINTFVFMGIWNFRKEINVWFGMWVFYTLFYNESYNLMRQWMAMSILIYAVVFLVKDKLFHYLFMVILAMSFHSSAIIGIVFLIVYRTIKNTKNNFGVFKSNKYTLRVRRKFLTTSFIIFLITVSCLNVNLIRNVLSHIGFSDYVAGYMKNGITFSLTKLIIVLPIVLLYIARYRLLKGDMKYFFAIIVFGSIVLGQFSTVTSYGGRILNFFVMYNVCVIPLLLKKNLALNFWVGVYCVVYWWYYFVLLNYNHTVPYMFG